MTVTTLLLTAAVATGGDPCPPACGCESPGILVKIRAKLSSAACAPCGTPLFAGFTTTCHEPADPCGRPGLLTRLKAKFQSVETCASSAATCTAAAVTCSTTPTPPGAMNCALPPAPAAPAAADAPKVMPKPEK